MVSRGVNPFLKAFLWTITVSSDFHGLGLEQLRVFLIEEVIVHLLLFLDFVSDRVSIPFCSTLPKVTSGDILLHPIIHEFIIYLSLNYWFRQFLPPNYCSILFICLLPCIILFHQIFKQNILGEPTRFQALIWGTLVIGFLLSQNSHPGVYSSVFPCPACLVGWWALWRDGYLGLPSIILSLY